MWQRVVLVVLFIILYVMLAMVYMVVFIRKQMVSQDYRLMVRTVILELQHIQIFRLSAPVVTMPAAQNIKLNRTVDFLMDIIVLGVIRIILFLSLFGRANIVIMFTVLRSLI